MPVALITNLFSTKAAGNAAQLLSIYPVYHGSPSAQQERRANFKGALVAVFGLDDIMAAGSTYQSAQSANLELIDFTDDDDGVVLVKVVNGEAAGYQKLVTNIPIDNFWDRAWVLHAQPTVSSVEQGHSLTPMMVFLCGLIITLSISIYLHIVFRRNNFIRHIVRLRTQELAEANRKLALLNHTDGLTGIANRRCFDQSLERVWQRAKRHRSMVALVFIDIDNFKDYNDYYGHLAGDECLKRVATALSTLVNRSEDLLARFGGEEFVILLPETDSPQTIAERCIKVIRSLAIPHEASNAAHIVTISAGCASYAVNQDADKSSLIDSADIALYEAKALGKNCFVDASQVAALNSAESSRKKVD